MTAPPEPSAPVGAQHRGAFGFELLKSGARGSRIRRGRCTTPNGSFETPCFAPVGTYASLKGLTPDQVAATGAELVLCNSYHLSQRPGIEVVRELGGLHRFMAWSGPILTDSGGYQVFSLDDRCKVDDDGVSFRSTVDGSLVRLTPERCLEIQRDLGPDIAMVLDQCPAGDADSATARQAHERTLRWAERQRALHGAWGGVSRGQALFGIVQGGTDPELRCTSADALVSMGFDGYAIGGLSVGETKDQMTVALDAAIDRLPTDQLRYLMGVGRPEDLIRGVRAGVDLFDCVIPTRHGRFHEAFTRQGKVKMRNLKHARDDAPLDADCGCYTCRTFSRAYLRHLAVAKEMLGGILLSLHNIQFLQDLMQALRAEAGGGAPLPPEFERVAGIG